MLCKGKDVTIIDFGLAVSWEITHWVEGEYVGSSFFSPQTHLLGDPRYCVYSCATDLESFAKTWIYVAKPSLTSTMQIIQAMQMKKGIASTTHEAVGKTWNAVMSQNNQVKSVLEKAQEGNYEDVRNLLQAFILESGS